METERIGPPLLAGERETLRAFLDFHRATLALKCEGLTDEELRRQSSPPSTLSLLGLVRHMAEVERTWFRRVINAEDVPLIWSATGDFQEAYDASASSRSEAFEAWQRGRSSTPAASSARPSRSTSPATRPAGARTSPCAW
ncbi:mycothiol transferase [Micromonospora chersina]